MIAGGGATSSLAGPFIITTTTQPQLTIRYDASNYLTTAVSSAGDATLLSTAGLALSATEGLNLTGQATSTTDTSGDIVLASAEDLTLRFATTSAFTLYHGPIARLAIDSSGNISATGTTIRLAGLTTIVGTAQIQATTTLATSQGRVGIGTTAPKEKLDLVFNSAGFGGRKFYTGVGRTSGSGPGNGFPITLNNEHGTTLNPAWHYRIQLTTTGTSVDTGSYWIVWYDEPTAIWRARFVSRQGSTSNHPLLTISGNNAIAYTNHSNPYSINYTVESIYKHESDGTAHALGADYTWQRDGSRLIYTDGYVGIGTTSPQAPLHIESAPGPQLRIGYDATNYFELNVTSQGSIQFRPSIDAAQAFQFQTAGGSETVLDIDTSGQMVGLGTTTPARKLDVSGSARIYDQSAGGVTTLELRAGISQSTNPLLSWQDSTGTTLGVISSQGYIGFGTTTPPTPLYIVGTSTLAGDLVFPTTSTISASAGILQIDICNIQNIATSSISTGGQELCGTNEVPNRVWYDSGGSIWKVECCTLK